MQVEYTRSYNYKNASAFQYCAFLKKVTFYWGSPLDRTKRPAIKASFIFAINRLLNKLPWVPLSPHVIPKFDFGSVTHLNEGISKICTHPLLICFQNLTHMAHLTWLNTIPLNASPYFDSMKILHIAPQFLIVSPKSFGKQSLAKACKFLIPSPPFEIGKHIVAHLTKWNLKLIIHLPNKKSLQSFSMRWAALVGGGNSDK